MPLKHGPIEGLPVVSLVQASAPFSMPLKHGPIEGTGGRTRDAAWASFPCP